MSIGIVSTRTSLPIHELTIGRLEAPSRTAISIYVTQPTLSEPSWRRTAHKVSRNSGVRSDASGAEVRRNWQYRDRREKRRHWQYQQKSQPVKHHRTQRSAAEEKHDQQRQQCQLAPVRANFSSARRAIPIEQPAQLDSDIGNRARHVRRPNLRIRYLCNHRVLQPHAEAHHRQ